MVLRSELNKRSPLRVFERSIHGGLGKGNIGVVTSRKGVGKTAMLIGIALDAALGERKVLHVTIGDGFAHLIDFYDEIFAELCRSKKLEDAADSRLTMERHRHLLSYRDHEFTIGRIRESLEFLERHADFVPEALIIDGWPDFESASKDDLLTLKNLAVEKKVELWVSALRHREGQKRDERDVPMEVARFDEFLSVIIRLEPRSDHVALRIVKDHENEELADLHLELDPSTLLLKWG
ncbi:MAG: hypothetical protein QF492_09485 [Candidatus Krumholzibacteria bacterium]|jgi:hypothetical protein|nr:hypothetical protein [Candidatus Krumholzibacteria bacterium]MDP6670117.1 hypothetical protein [Candidatus Krumholzibacteria bacterium]MDP6796635.1 hypothetical protein [Candidatus Krumholzibacteria bacterium]MDP7022043.1 hypothetical protein [Candidatus Krumholzibacteria bacterium]